MHAIVLTLLALIGSWSATVPFQYHDNRMLVACKINGHGPFAMIVDTGSPDVAITFDAAKALGLKVRNAGTVTGAGNKAVENGNTTLNQLTIGSLPFRNMNADVLDLTEIQTKFHFARLDGIIGYPVLKQFATFVNVDDGTLSFGKSPHVLPDGATRTTFSGVLPIIHAKINNIPTTVLVDTGDRSSLTLFGPFAKRYGFYGRYPSKRNVITGYGLGGPIYGDVFTLPQLDAFGTPLTNIVTRASRQTAGAFASPDQGGSIGTGVLKRFNIVWDYPHRTIIAWPSKYFKSQDIFRPPG